MSVLNIISDLAMLKLLAVTVPRCIQYSISDLAMLKLLTVTVPGCVENTIARAQRNSVDIKHNFRFGEIQQTS